MAKTKNLALSDVYKILVYYCEERLTQVQIADKLSLKPYAVSRCLTHYENVLFSRGAPSLIGGALDVTLLDQARKECGLDWVKLQDELRTPLKLLPTTPTIHVVGTGDLTEQGTGEEQLRRLSHSAADHVVGLFKQFKAENVGVSWGRTIYHLCEGIRMSDVARRWKEERRASPMRFVPISGDLLNNPDVRLTSSHLANILHKSINGVDEGALSLGTAAAYIPSKFDDAQAEMIREFFMCFANYRTIFQGEGQKPPLIGQLDSVVMSVGSSSKDLEDDWLDDVAKLGKVSRERLEEITLGNIANFFLPRSGLPAGDRNVVKFINERWTGVRQEHIHACAINGALGKCAGVIVLAAGISKAIALKACVTSGLANHVFIDTELAHELLVARPS